MTEIDKTKEAEAAFDKIIEASTMNEAYKKALKERTMQKVCESSQGKTIFGLNNKPGSKRGKITLGNGLTVNTDAFDE